MTFEIWVLGCLDSVLLTYLNDLIKIVVDNKYIIKQTENRAISTGVVSIGWDSCFLSLFSSNGVYSSSYLRHCFVTRKAKLIDVYNDKDKAIDY